jgi:outer membrane protein assembly factor BamD (BamD/ComL family)
MPRILAVALVLALVPVVPLCHGQNCCAHNPATRTKAKSKGKHASKEARAAAQLEKAQRLLNAGKKKQAIRRLRNIVSRYPKTKAAINAMIILDFMPQ